MRRYVLAPGLAASEVGALMMIWSIIALVSGWKSWGVSVDILLFAVIGAWLWWKKSTLAAGLMLALVGFEYGFLVYNAIASGKGSTWLVAYPVMFLFALSAHTRRPKEATAS